MAIRVLASDFGRVIGTFESRAGVVAKLARQLNTWRQEDQFELHKLFGVRENISPDQEIFYESLDMGSASVEDLWLQFLAHFGIKEKVCPLEFFRQEWCRHLQMIEPVVALYRIVQEKYPIVGISNGDRESLRHFTGLLQTKGRLQFYRLFLSGFDHQKKPELFDLAVKNLARDGIRPQDCVYVDDRPLYVREARRRLFRAFCFDATAYPTFDEAACHLKSELAKRGLAA